MDSVGESSVGGCDHDGGGEDVEEDGDGDMNGGVGNGGDGGVQGMYDGDDDEDGDEDAAASALLANAALCMAKISSHMWW